MQELAKAMRFLGMHPSQEEINNIINLYDLDGDGHIDFTEYKQIYIAYLKLHSVDALCPQSKKLKVLFESLILTKRG